MHLIPESRRVLDALEARGNPGLAEALAVRAALIADLVPSCIAICLALSSGVTIALTGPVYLARRPLRTAGPDLGDVLSERRWQHERAGDADARCAASIAIALHEQDQMTGQLTAYATRPDAFTACSHVLLPLLGAPAQTAVLNHDLPMRALDDAREGPARLAEREAVEIAVGYLMARDRTDAETARRELTAAARAAGLELSAYAKAVVGQH
ncbi:ANTAR domain-containing protein [Cellulomonas sp. URHB0016]